MHSSITCDLVSKYGDINLGQHWVRWWLGAINPEAIIEPMLNFDYWDSKVLTLKQSHSVSAHSTILGNEFEIILLNSSYISQDQMVKL